MTGAVHPHPYSVLPGNAELTLPPNNSCNMQTLADGFFTAASFAGFLPSIGISILFWPAAAFRSFLEVFAAFAGAASRTALHRVSISLSTLLAARLDLGMMSLPARFWLMKSIRAHQTDVEDLNLLAIFCAAGLLLSLMAAMVFSPKPGHGLI